MKGHILGVGGGVEVGVLGSFGKRVMGAPSKMVVSCLLELDISSFLVIDNFSFCILNLIHLIGGLYSLVFIIKFSHPVTPLFTYHFIIIQYYSFGFRL